MARINAMADNTLDEKLQEALDLHENGKNYSEIRAYFKDVLDEDAISYIIRLVDEFVIEEKRIEEEIKKVRFRKQVGLAAFILSAFLLYLLHTNHALENISTQWIYSVMMLVQYFPVAFSLYYLWKARQAELELKKTQPEIDDSKFRLKRRRKGK